MIPSEIIDCYLMLIFQQGNLFAVTLEKELYLASVFQVHLWLDCVLDILLDLLNLFEDSPLQLGPGALATCQLVVTVVLFAQVTV